VTVTNAGTSSSYVQFIVGYPLELIQGALTIQGKSGGADFLQVVDFSPNPQTFTVTANTVSRTGIAPISYNNQTQLFLSTSSQALATVNVESTAAGTTTTVIGRTGGSTFNLSPGAHNLANLAGLLNINGQGGTNTLNVFDQATTFSPSAPSPGDILYQDHLVRNDTTGRTLFTYGGIQSVNVSAGRGDNVGENFFVFSTPAGVPVTVSNAGPGTSFIEFLVGNNSRLNDIQGPLTVHGRAGGIDLLELTDFLNPNPQTYTVTANAVSRTGIAPISYDNQTQLLLYTSGQALATVNVQSTAAAAFTQIGLLTAGDRATLSAPSIHDLRIAGVPVSVTVDDSSDIMPRTAATFRTDPTYRYLLSGLAPGQIFLDVDPGSSVQVQAGSGDNVFRMADVPTFALSLNGGTGANTLDYSAYTGNVIVDLQTGFATGIAGGLSGNFVSVHGANSTGSGLYNLLIGNGGDTLTGGTGRRNILVAGVTASTLNAGSQEDLLIAGTTSYDNDPSDPGLLNWQQIAAYWAGPDDFITRMGNLQTGNGVPLLDATTVTGNGGGNTMNGLGGLALVYTDLLDTIAGFNAGYQTYAISP
jgi:hypothetical protein